MLLAFGCLGRCSTFVRTLPARCHHFTVPVLPLAPLLLFCRYNYLSACRPMLHRLWRRAAARTWARCWCAGRCSTAHRSSPSQPPPPASGELLVKWQHFRRSVNKDAMCAVCGGVSLSGQRVLPQALCQSQDDKLVCDTTPLAAATLLCWTGSCHPRTMPPSARCPSSSAWSTEPCGW